MSPYARLKQELRDNPRVWLVTGMAGFIGSHLLETLLSLDQRVIGLDNFSTGTPKNLHDVKARVSAAAWDRFECVDGSVADVGKCRDVTRDVDYVLHQAGFVSVPLSIEDPVACHDTNVTGTLNLLIAARDRKVRRVVYASSSAIYGDDPRLPKREEYSGRPLSPYGASKAMGESYARLFSEHYALGTVGLRYFNVFGPRQNPVGGYAAVIPQWISAMLEGRQTEIHGDGSATRDFCPVANVVQANLLAAAAPDRPSEGLIYNVGLGMPTTLTDLHAAIAQAVHSVTGKEVAPVRRGASRPGDITHSSGDIARIAKQLGFEPEVTFIDGLQESVRWYADNPD